MYEQQNYTRDTFAHEDRSCHDKGLHACIEFRVIFITTGESEWALRHYLCGKLVRGARMCRSSSGHPHSAARGDRKFGLILKVRSPD